MIQTFKCFLIIVVISVLSVECRKNSPEVILPKATDVAQAEDREKIEAYLKTHFYNYEDFKNPPKGFDYKVKIQKIEGVNANKTPLAYQVKSKTVVIDDVDHTINYLILKEGVGENPKFIDSVLVAYKGELLDGRVFDSRSNLVWFDLARTVRGWREILPLFKVGIADPVENIDGTIDFANDGGIGFFVMPSKLGYFSVSKIAIPAYSPLVFSFSLLRKQQADHDGDGIPSYLEDLNDNGNVFDDNTDGDLRPNYDDDDDDNDNTDTKDEYDVDKDGVIDDADGDGVPDYLDKT